MKSGTFFVAKNKVLRGFYGFLKKFLKNFKKTLDKLQKMIIMKLKIKKSQR